MSPDALSIFGLVAVLLPTIYFLIASPAFLVAKFEDPSVQWVFRGLLSFHFRLIAIGSAAGTLALALAGRPGSAAGLALVGVLAMAVRGWFLRRVDAELGARAAGDAQSIRRLRGLHLRGMAYNVMQLVALVVILSVNPIGVAG